jgi:outer membrane protein OmpA-like peptidoglycan-associated protein
VDDIALAAEGYDEATALEVLKAASADALEPRFEVVQPSVAIFAPGTAELDSKAKHYLDLMAPTLMPGGKRRLVLEGHGEAGADGAQSARLALERAEAVRAYLIDEHAADPKLIHARGWLTAAADYGMVRPIVDARVLTEDD